MRLILSSCDFSNPSSRKCITEHLPVSLDRCRVLFIPNEKATAEKIRSGKYHTRLQKYGFSRENIHVFDSAQADRFIGLSLDAIYVSGGNTFLTMQKLRSCGFDRELVKYVQNGVTYIGGSAGAHLVTQNIAHVAAYDEMPTDMTDLAGLGLFRGIFLCHYTPERYMYCEALRAKNSFRVYTLTDEESLVIEE